MRIYPRRGPRGHITLFYAPIGSAEARRAGFLTPEGESLVLEKVVDEAAHTITIRIAKEQPKKN